ncbi:hypothetical protein B0H14DRAFT_2532529 [Mycena olivaceomarginata]|nr:hypothetical protein B0H14DRAFT_2532529 [Mycena olivaceomarginata]
MARLPSVAAAQKATKKTKKSSGRQKTATAEIEALQSKKAAARSEYSNAKKTKAAYSGYIARSRVIIADIVKERRVKEKAEPGWKCPDGIDIELLAVALEGNPNKLSAMALELCLTQKCIVEGLGKSTAEGLHGAWAKYWDELQVILPGGKYAGAYQYDEDTDKVTGCPARAPEIQAFLKCIKNKSRIKGEAATRRHAEATAIEDMQKMMRWSESQCATEKVEKCQPKDVAELLLFLKHAMMRAFLSSGYCLWTRNFELCQLQERDLTPDAKGPAPYYLPVLGVFLDNRKGWQKKQGYDGPLESNHYDIYEQKDTPEICMYTHFMRWRAVYRQRLGRDFEADDYAFPYIAPNGIIHSKRPMSHDLVQEYINEFAQGAGIDKIFTTHCLRRGGSQYRFMFAPIGKRWSLTIIRWWGGWAEGEQVDTLMRYLMDSLQSYESGHGDALNPHRLEADKSFMGDHDALKAPTVTEFRTLSEQILTKLDNFSIQIQSDRVSSTPTTTSSSGSITTAVNLVASSLSLLPAAGIHPTSLIPGTSNSSHHSTSAATQGLIPMDEDPPTTTIPIAGVSIPSVGKGPDAWRRAVDQWIFGDPAVGLMPLNKWPPEYYKGPMRLITGALYGQRKLLGMEYERLGSDDGLFKERYPEHPHMTKLLLKIRANSGRTRSSRT